MTKRGFGTMANWKEIWSDTPAHISGSIVLVILIEMVGLVAWSGFCQPASTMKYAIAAAIGGTFAYKIFRHGRITLDPERTVTGKLARAIGMVGAILFALATTFALLTFGGR